MARDRYKSITFLLYGAACPSSLSSLTMGEIDLLVSQIPTSVFFSRVRKILDLGFVTSFPFPFLSLSGYTFSKCIIKYQLPGEGLQDGDTSGVFFVYYRTLTRMKN